MVKKKVGGGKRYQAAIKAKADHEDGAPPARLQGPAPPKHVQRKISKKVNFLDKVAASKKAAMAAKSVISKKRKVSQALTDLSSLSGTVNELLQEQLQQKQLLGGGGAAKRKKPLTAKAKKAEAKAVRKQPAAVKARKKFGEAVGTQRARTVIMAKESARAQQVMQHPLYQLDPILAITNHLNATLPPAPVQPRQQADTRRSKGKKKKAGKDASVADMED